MNLWHRLPTSIVLACLGLLPASVPADDAAEVPQGYEDAPAASDAAPQPAPVAAFGAPAWIPAAPALPVGPAIAPGAPALMPVAPAIAPVVPAPVALPAEPAEADVEIPPGYEDAAMAAPPANPPLLPPMVGAVAGQVLEAPADPNDPMLRNLEQQFLPQFQQVLQAELAFVRRAAALDQQQYERLAARAAQRLPAAVRPYAVAQNAMQQGRLAIGNENDFPDPEKLVRQQMMAVAEAQLSAEQLGRYRQECDLRAASRRRAVVLNMVAKLDEQLVLTAEQRDKLAQSLTEHYQKDWDRWLILLAQSVQIQPEIPDPLVLPLLDERQKAVWGQTPKQGPFFFQGIMGAPAVINDDVMVEGVIEFQAPVRVEVQRVQ